uniref:insulin receptor substrate 2-A-like n=1 Tax=Scatophagus argus TaxID=75038 RepID=UPI001ED84F19|nr:insulin receptor substrate 2-A-like [Scatophagus argus]
MDETAEGHNQKRPASHSPPSSVSSTQTWLPVVSPCQKDQDQEPRAHHAGMQSSPQCHFFEELFCTRQASNTLVPLAGTLMTSFGSQSDVVKQGYLGKLERNHRKYFVLRAGSHTGPSRLEWYKSQEKFAAMEKSAGKSALFGSRKQGVIYLSCCLGVSRIGSTRKGHSVAVYAKDQTMVLVAEDHWEQEGWYLAIKRLMEEEQRDEERGEGFDEEDDGYCTLPPAAFFKEVWPVTVKPRGLGCSKSLAGESRLCLTASSLIVVRMGACADLPSVTIPLLSVRRFGHFEGLFFLELGRSAPNGPGEIWMEAREQGNPTVAQHIHEVVRQTVMALRALPDFSLSPASNHNRFQTLLPSKRCRPRYRDKLQNVRPLGSRLTLPPRSPENPQNYSESCKSDKPEPESTVSSTSHLSPFRSNQGSVPETSSYVEMKVDCSAARRMEGWEPAEEDEEGLGYMMMSPQVSHGLSVLPQDDYVAMARPNKHDLTASSSLQTSFDSHSPLHPSQHQAIEHSRPHCVLTSVQQAETEAGQSERANRNSTRPQEDAGQEQKSAQQGRLPPQTRTTWSPVRSVDGPGMMKPFVTSEPGVTRPVQASPTSGTGRSSRLQGVWDQSVRRSQLSLCLPSCLKAENRS